MTTTDLNDRSHSSTDLAPYERDGSTLTPRPGGLAERVRAKVGGDHPAAAVALVFVLSFVALAAVTTAAGMLLTHVLEHGFLGRWDHSVSRWFVHHRTHFETTLSGIGTIMAETFTVIGVVLVVTVILLMRHWGRRSFLLVAALVLELTVFLTANTLVKRPRPTVPHIGHTPSTYSFPSGHSAAAIALYCGIAVLVTVATTRLLPRVAIWLVAIVLAVGVALSRVYRGEHYATDVIAGTLMGIGALSAAIFVVRVAVADRSRATNTPAVGTLTSTALPGSDS